MTNHSKTFGDVHAYSDGNEWAFSVYERLSWSEDRLNQLADDIRSAQCWVREVRRRQAENQTPELPMQ